MLLTSENMWDYIKCPLHYYFKNVAGFNHYLPSKDDMFKEVIEKMIKFYYYSLLDGKVPSMQEMKLKYNSMLKSMMQQTRKDPVENPLVASKKDYERRGLAYIVGFYNWASKNASIPVAIDKEFIINVGDHRLSGNIEILRQTADKKIDLLIIKTWESMPDDFMIDTDLDITLQYMAVRSIYDIIPDSATIYVVKNSIEMVTTRNQDQIKRLITVANNVAKSIENNIYYPRWNLYCKKCDHKELCKHWYK